MEPFQDLEGKIGSFVRLFPQFAQAGISQRCALGPAIFHDWDQYNTGFREWRGTAGKCRLPTGYGS